MQAEEKLEEARYFLTLLQNTPQDNAHEKEFMYLVSAFLSSWRSVFDIMLYDYAAKFSLGFSRDEEITERDFEIAARVTNNTQALLFLRWWRQQLNVLAQNPVWTKRKVIVHRGYPPTMHVYTLFISGSIALTSSTVFTSSARASISFSSSAVPPLTTTTTSISGPSAIPTAAVTSTALTPTSTTAQIRFLDFQDRGVTDYCQQAFRAMEATVQSTIRQFGR